MKTSFYELAMNDDRLSKQWVPSIANLGDIVLGGIVLCGSITESETTTV